MDQQALRRRQGVASRRMIAEDARWAGDAIQSLRVVEANGTLALPLFGHTSRIVYEGSSALRSPRIDVGIPSLAALLPSENDPVTVRARHATKLLDNRPKRQESTAAVYGRLGKELFALYERHHEEFFGNAVWFARWLEADLGMTTIGGSVIYGTVPQQYRLGFPSTLVPSHLGPYVREVAEEQGRVLATLARAGGDDGEMDETIHYESLGRISSRDRKAAKYLGRRFDTDLPLAAKLLVLMIEGEANTTRLVLPVTAMGHEEAVFRATTISLVHVLRAVNGILEQCSDSTAASTRALRSLMAEPLVDGIANGRPAQVLRNRCMHYPMVEEDLEVDLQAPMFGLVEALVPGHTYDSFRALMLLTLDRVCEALRLWRP